MAVVGREGWAELERLCVRDTAPTADAAPTLTPVPATAASAPGVRVPVADGGVWDLGAAAPGRAGKATDKAAEDVTAAEGTVPAGRWGRAGSWATTSPAQSVAQCIEFFDVMMAAESGEDGRTDG